MKAEVKFIWRGARCVGKVCKIDGVEVSEEEYDRRLADKPVGCPLDAHMPALWPMKSEALSVQPKQAAEANERARRHNIAARYDKDGTCEIDSRSDRKKLIHLERFVDKAAGYGD